MYLPFVTTIPSVRMHTDVCGYRAYATFFHFSFLLFKWKTHTGLKSERPKWNSNFTQGHVNAHKQVTLHWSNILLQSETPNWHEFTWLNLNNNETMGEILMDLSKAFHCVPHDLLLAKLSANSNDDNLILYTHSYLLNRKQCVCINNILRESNEFISGCRWQFVNHFCSKYSNFNVSFGIWEQYCHWLF